MAADDTPEQAFDSHMLESAVSLVADAERVDKRQVARRAGRSKAPAQRLQQLVGDGVTRAGAADRDGRAVFDLPQSAFGRDDGLFQGGGHQ